MTLLGVPSASSSHPGVDAIGSRSAVDDSVTVYRLSPSGSASGIRVGSDCVIHRDVRLVLGDPHQTPDTGLVIGDRVHINVGAYLSGEGGLTIGDDVLIGPHAKLLSAGHQIDDANEAVSHAPLTHGPVRIGPGAWVGAGAIVLEGVTIGRGAAVAAGAVVTRDVPDFAVVAGVPARIVRFRKGFAPSAAGVGVILGNWFRRCFPGLQKK